MTLDHEHLLKTGERKLIRLDDLERRAATRNAKADLAAGLPCDPTRHGARVRSQTGQFYIKAYNNALEAAQEG